MGAGGSPCPHSPSAKTCPRPSCAAWPGASRTAAPPCGCWRSPTYALDGFSRAEAARLAGMERQALRDAALRYDAEGPGGLHDRPRSGRPEGLTPGQQAALKAWVLRGPDPERDGVSAWRLVDVCARAERAYGVRYSAWGMSRLLKRLNLSRQKTRPRHPEGSAAERAAFGKGARTEARRHRRSPSGSATPALV